MKHEGLKGMIEGKGPAQNGRDCIIYHASVPKRIGKTKERGSEKRQMGKKIHTRQVEEDEETRKTLRLWNKKKMGVMGDVGAYSLTSCWVLSKCLLFLVFE